MRLVSFRVIGPAANIHCYHENRFVTLQWIKPIKLGITLNFKHDIDVL